MIRRNKENREAYTLRRERTKDLQEKLHKKGRFENARITLEELEKIEKATREKEKEDKRYYLRWYLIILGTTAIIMLLVWYIFL